MNHKHVFAGCITTIAICGASVALGFGQPDGIDPPAGPVADTQPSLTSIDQKLDIAIGSNDLLIYKANQFPSLAQNTPQTLQLNGDLYIKRVIVQNGRISMRDANDIEYILDAGNVSTPQGNQRLSNFTYELEIALVGPITLTSIDNANSSDVIIVYRELP